MTAAERQRRYRQRQRRCETVFAVTVKDRVIERLIEAGRLTDEEAMSRPHIEIELSALLEEASGLLA